MSVDERSSLLNKNMETTTDDANALKAAIDIQSEACCSRDTFLKLISNVSLLILNILVVLLYDDDKFNRSTIFWSIFAFGYVCSLDALRTNMIILTLLYIGQYVLYLFFCNFNELSSIIFSILLFLIISCGSARKILYGFCVNKKNQLIWSNIYSKAENQYKCCSPAKWWNSIGFSMIFVTVPMFYFDQSTLWGTSAFAISVVIVLWDNVFIEIFHLLFRDYYVSIMIKDIKTKQCDESLLEKELSRPVQSYKYQFVLDNIIPLLYSISLCILLIFYLISYDDLTTFEMVYAIILCVCIPTGLCIFSCAVYLSEPKLRGELAKVLASAKQDPPLSDLYGTWVIDNPQHPFKTFTLTEDNITQVDESEKHELGCCRYGITDIYASSIIGAIQLPVPQATVRYGNFCGSGKPWYFRWIQPQGYKFILHANGVVKFVPIGESFLHMLMLARTDSAGWMDWIKNLKHGNKYGCFCLGILTKDGKLKRYNRWNNDVDYYYTATLE